MPPSYRPSKLRRRSHEPQAPVTGTGQTIDTTGRSRDRRKAVLDEWFASASSQGKGTSKDFAAKVNKYVAQHADHCQDRDLTFEAKDMGHYLAAKVREGNSRVSKKAADKQKKSAVSWTIGTPQDYRPNIVTIDRRTLESYKATRQQLKEALKFKPRPELPEVVDGDEFFDAAGQVGDVDGLRQRAFSSEYKLAVRNAL